MSKCLQKFNPRAVPPLECNGTACSRCADPCEIAAEVGQLEPAGVKRASERWECCGVPLDVEAVGLQGCANCEGTNSPKLVQDFGHCGHAPQCINDGVMDDRDPFGCCRCGDRKREEQAKEAAQRLTGSDHTAACEQRQRDGRAANRQALMRGSGASPVECTCSTDGRGLYARGEKGPRA